MKVGEKETRSIVEKKTGKVIKEVTFEVFESGAFQYGNQTSTLVKYRESKNKNSFDTRYFTGSLKDFIEAWKDGNLNQEEYELR